MCVKVEAWEGCATRFVHSRFVRLFSLLLCVGETGAQAQAEERDSVVRMQDKSEKSKYKGGRPLRSLSRLPILHKQTNKHKHIVDAWDALIDTGKTKKVKTHHDGTNDHDHSSNVSFKVVADTIAKKQKIKKNDE